MENKYYNNSSQLMQVEKIIGYHALNVYITR